MDLQVLQQYQHVWRLNLVMVITSIILLSFNSPSFSLSITDSESIWRACSCSFITRRMSMDIPICKARESNVSPSKRMRRSNYTLHNPRASEIFLYASLTRLLMSFLHNSCISFGLEPSSSSVIVRYWTVLPSVQQDAELVRVEHALGQCSQPAVNVLRNATFVLFVDQFCYLLRVL